MALREYKAKRDFSKTAEPKAALPRKKSKKAVFVIQKHAARRLHYDFRIEVDGVLKSWAVPKAPSMSKKDKRLAVHTEDHPMKYADYEGVIPKGNYGAGNMEIWDRGHFVNMTIKDGKLEPLSKWIKEGHFIIWVKGDRLRGGFAFNRLKNDPKNWLLIKMDDEEALENRRDIAGETKFVKVAGKEITVTNANKEIFANISKEQFVDYHIKVAKLMVPHLKDRPISMYRFPHGMREQGFFQKHVPDHFPKWMKRVQVSHKNKKINFIMADDAPSLAYLATQVITPHILPARYDKIEYPDKMIFDLDPMTRDLEKLKRVALDTKQFLEDIGMPTFIMTSGNKGYHIVVPLDRSTKQDAVKKFAQKIASVLASHFSETISAEMRIEKREDRIFIDTYRNSLTHTAVAPYAVRDSLRGGIAVPIDWKELKKVHPHYFTLDNIAARFKKKNPWEKLFKETVSVEKIMKQLKK